MKPNHAKENLRNARTGVALKNACLARCQKILAQIAKVKEAVLAESRDSLKAQERLLHLALNEAEALAWESRYPQLFFPDLATEKIRAVTVWNNRQGSMRRMGKIISLAE